MKGYPINVDIGAWGRYGNGKYLRVACPTCGAQPYQECKPIGGHAPYKIKSNGNLHNTVVGPRRTYPHYRRTLAGAKADSA